MKYFGKLGFVEWVEGPVGVFRETITEYDYFGDITRVINHSQGPKKSVTTLNSTIS